MSRFRTISILTAACASSVALGGVARADALTTISAPDGGVVEPDGWTADFTQVHVGPDTGGGRQWLRRDEPDGSASFLDLAARRCLDLSDPDDGGSQVVIRACSPASASQRWIRRGTALVDRDTGECATAIPRLVDGKPDRVLVGAECVAGDPAQAWALRG